MATEEMSRSQYSLHGATRLRPTTNRMPLSLGLEFLNTNGQMVIQQIWWILMAGAVIT
jgi:hypothetical protein